LIDWDTAGFGYFGEDIAALIADEADVENMAALYERCVPAYYRGFSEYSRALADVKNPCVREMIIFIFGYRLVGWYKFPDDPEKRFMQVNTLQKIYEMKHSKLIF